MNYKIFKTDLKPWLKKFFFEKFSYIVKAITGTIITITDGIRKKIIESKMSKESSQETTTGKNKFNMFDFSVGSNVAIASLDAEKIVLTAEKTQGSQFVKNFVKNVDKTKTYVFSLKGKKTQAKGDAKNLRGYFYGSDDDIDYIRLDSMTIGGVENQEYSYSVSLTGYSNYRFYLYNYSDATVPLGETTEFYDIQFEEGTQQTEWEEFTNGPSPNPDYPQEIKTVKGYRNEFDGSNLQEFTYNGITITPSFKNGLLEHLVVNGTATANFTRLLGEISIDDKYEKCFLTGCPSGTNAGYRLTVYTYNSNDEYIAGYIDTGNGIIIDNSNVSYYRLYLIVNNGVTLNNVIFKPMITEGTEEKPYVPYGSNYVYKKIQGKSLYGGFVYSRTTNGITFTHNFDGSITANGTASANAFSMTGTNGGNDNLLSLNAGTYTISTNNSNTYIQVINSSGILIVQTNSNITFTINEKTDIYVRLLVNSGTTLNNVTIKPMLEPSTQATSYEPYQENIITIPLNGNEIAGTDSAHKDILLVDSDGHCYLQKNTRGLELAIADMDNNENYPGWRNQVQLKDDYPNVSGSAYQLGISFMSNITKNNSLIRINCLNANAIIYLEKAQANLTQSQWKEQYPNLVFKLLYSLQTPDIIDLNYTVDIRLFKGVNNISNSDDMDMEIKYYSK